MHTRSLNTRHVTLTTHPQATTEGAKAPAPCPRAAARGSRVHTANTIHTHPTLARMTGTLATIRALNNRAPTYQNGGRQNDKPVRPPTPPPAYDAANDEATAPGPAPQHQPAPPTTASNCSQGGYRVQVQLGDGGMGRGTAPPHRDVIETAGEEGWR